MTKRIFRGALALLLALALCPGVGLATAATTLGTSTTLINPSLTDKTIIKADILDPGTISVVLLAPSDLTATASSTSEIELSWKDNSFNETGFEVERKIEGGTFTKIASAAAGSTSYTDASLAAGTTYYYQVRACNASKNSSYTNEASATTTKALLVKPDLGLPGDIILGTIPLAPGKLTATATSGTEVKLNWVDNSNNETGFKVERKSGGAKDFVELNTLKANANLYTDSGLSNDNGYTYRVRAFNAKGSSQYSNEASVLTPTDIYAQEVKTVVYHIGQTTYYLNGSAYPMDVAPTIINGSTFIPIRYIGEPLGANIAWDASQQRVMFELDGTTVELWVGNNVAKVNGVDTPISANPDVVPQIISARLFVPLAFVATSLGCDVTWDGALQEIKVVYPKNW